MDLEKEIENEYVKQAYKLYKARALKLILKDEKGFPDRTVILNNCYTFYIEFKRSEKDKPSPQQLRWHKTLEAQGCNVYICWTLKQALYVTFKEVGLNG